MVTSCGPREEQISGWRARARARLTLGLSSPSPFALSRPRVPAFADPMAERTSVAVEFLAHFRRVVAEKLCRDCRDVEATRAALRRVRTSDAEGKTALRNDWERQLNDSFVDWNRGRRSTRVTAGRLNTKDDGSLFLGDEAFAKTVAMVESFLRCRENEQALGLEDAHAQAPVVPEGGEACPQLVSRYEYNCGAGPNERDTERNEWFAALVATRLVERGAYTTEPRLSQDAVQGGRFVYVRSNGDAYANVSARFMAETFPREAFLRLGEVVPDAGDPSTRDDEPHPHEDEQPMTPVAGTVATPAPNESRPRVDVVSVSTSSEHVAEQQQTPSPRVTRSTAKRKEQEVSQAEKRQSPRRKSKRNVTRPAERSAREAARCIELE